MYGLEYLGLVGCDALLLAKQFLTCRHVRGLLGTEDEGTAVFSNVTIY
jgi:hypothetical protein